jgi:hypothetical protein
MMTSSPTLEMVISVLAETGGKVIMRPGGEGKVVAYLMDLLVGEAEADELEHAMGELAHCSVMLKQRGSPAGADAVANALRAFVAQLQSLVSERRALSEHVAHRTRRKIATLLGGPDTRPAPKVQGPAMSPLAARMRR